MAARRKREPVPQTDLPSPLLSDTPGTWAFDTMSRRIREDILERTVRDNAAELALRPNAARALAELDAELRQPGTTPISYLASGSSPKEISTWNDQILRPWVENGSTWLTAPWMVTEFYFYRRVAAAFGWVADSPDRIDPFRAQKELGVTSALQAMETVASRLNQSCRTPGDPLKGLQTWILASLWGNKMDLSIWPVGESASAQAESTFDAIMSSGAKQLLANDLLRVIDHVRAATASGPVDRIDIIIDNAGFELFCDMCLADFLVSAGLSKEVFIHMKSHPTFVSDALSSDLLFLANALIQNTGQSEATGKRWMSHLESGAWQLRADDFWVQGSPLWSMPDPLYDNFANSSTLAFLKGDANYRRLLGDLTWPVATTPFSTVARCFPAPLCALRIFKAEVGCGVSDVELNRAKGEDPQFFVSGKWGVIQFHSQL